jgi:hypothetical protein
MHASQRPLHAKSQQTPSEHSHVVEPGHSMSGSVPVATWPHVPFAPEPFLAVVQA